MVRPRNHRARTQRRANGSKNDVVGIDDGDWIASWLLHRDLAEPSQLTRIRTMTAA